MSRTRGVLAAGVLGLLALAACGGSVYARRAMLCRRAVPALVPPDATVNLLRVAAGSSPDTIRVDYRLAGRPEAAKARWVVCGFGPGASLASVATESGALSGAAVYLLKRYYLDTPEAAAADPGRR